MKEHYRAVVVGGGVVGASVLYHLAKLGWADVLMIERSELTAGSTWHAAAGFHALNGDPNVAALQDYTIKLYKELEEESGTSLGVHWTGGVNIASTPERWEWLQSAWAVFQTVGIESARLMGPEEIAEVVPIADLTGVYGGLWDDNEGYLDAVGTTFAYVAAARKRGAEVVLHNRVLELHPRPASAGGGWTVVTEQGTVTCEHVVNAAGLWARQVGRMAGVDLPVTPMEHHYLVTEEVPEVAAFSAGGRELPMSVDLEGFTYLRQEGKGVLLGVYELAPQHWNLDGVPWDYGVELIPENLERIEPQLMKGFERYPCLNEVGIKKWVNGAFTFTPDGNPLVGPVPGRPGYWVACGVMAGFSQGGGVGLSLAEWMVHGEPGRDVFGMDVARYGRFAGARPYLKATTAQFYSRRFMMSYPNEQLPAGRPLRTSALHTRLVAAGARWGVSWGLETPLYFTPDASFEETPTLRRSNAFELVGAECRAAREGVALLDTTSFSRYEVRGPGAREWLDGLLACALPKVGRAKLAPMLSPSGRLTGDLTVLCWGEDEYWLMGSYYLRAWHLRWFDDHLPPSGVRVRDLSDDVAGVAVVGPRSRELLARITADDVSGAALKFLGLAEIDAGLTTARVGRLSVTGELGFELNLPAGELPGVYDALLAAGEDLGVRPLGYNALNSLRLEKSFGIWSREFTWAYTPGMSGMDRFVAFDKGDFVGRDAALRERDSAPPAQLLVTLDVDATDSDAIGFEPVWSGDRRVGFVTSGGYGHTIGRSLAMAYLDRSLAEPGTALEVHILGVRRPAVVVAASPVDPTGSRMRG